MFQVKVENAQRYLCKDELTIAQQVQAIETYPNKTDFIDNVEGVCVWEPLENTFTCEQFIKMIS
jgi:hypothetical protein